MKRMNAGRKREERKSTRKEGETTEQKLSDAVAKLDREVKRLHDFLEKLSPVDLMNFNRLLELDNVRELVRQMPPRMKEWRDMALLALAIRRMTRK